MTRGTTGSPPLLIPGIIRSISTKPGKDQLGASTAPQELFSTWPAAGVSQITSPRRFSGANHATMLRFILRGIADRKIDRERRQVGATLSLPRAARPT
jgi:hypothetical protein